MKFLTSLSRLFSLILIAAMFAGCGAVPLTGRCQLLLVSDQEVFEAGLTQYKEYVSTAVMSGNADATAVVKSVGTRMAAAVEQYLKATGYESELANFAWEFNLVKDNQVNAFCMPGGKIVVYEGLLSVAQTEDELAVVLGHEIAHAVAKHSNERVSQQMMTQYGAAIIGAALSKKSVAVQNVATSVFGLGAQVGLMLPYSRKHEYEADYMGVVFMELAGYDSTAAIGFWTKMAGLSSGSSSSSEATKKADASDFLSTHPSDTKRISELQKRIPEAKRIAREM